jgi:CTP synthase
LEDAGLAFSGMSPDRSLVEFVELPREVHPYYVGTQAHPEFRSRPHRAHPLFSGLVEAAVNRQRAERLVEVDVVDSELDPAEAAAVAGAASGVSATVIA